MHNSWISDCFSDSLIWIYGIGYVVGIVMGIINLRVIYRLLTGTITESELLQVVEAEGLPDAEKQLKEAKA